MANRSSIIIGGLGAVIIIGAASFFVAIRAERDKTAALMAGDFKGQDNNAAVQIKIKEQTPEGEYNDSLYYTAEQWASKTPADIEADKKARVDQWLSLVKNPAPAANPTQEEVQAQE